MVTYTVYQQLAARLGHGHSAYLPQIMECAVSPRQGRIVVELPVAPAPAVTAEELAVKLDLKSEEVRNDLEDLFRKGLAFPRNFQDRREWRGPRSLNQIHDSMLCGFRAFSEQSRLIELWRAYDEKERYAILAKDRAERPEPVWRVVPAWRSVMDNPHLQPWEDWREILRGFHLISAIPCPCRIKVQACQRPVEVCLDFDRAAEYDIASVHGRKVSYEEAVQIMDDAAKAGLVGQARNVRMTTSQCNCCADCCVEFVPLNRYGVPLSQVWAKSRFEARIEKDLCTGCQNCIDQCNFNAISIVPVPGSKRLKAQINAEDCFGCGCCYMVCEPQAIAMECFHPEAHVPEVV
ncbi:MAG: hypothetical protein HY664_07635 [Chloroflexi bacterium]|nr:hypothetical protein [Chloroflexota bacterium]